MWWKPLCLEGFRSPGPGDHIMVGVAYNLQLWIICIYIYIDTMYICARVTGRVLRPPRPSQGRLLHLQGQKIHKRHDFG